MNEKIKVFEAFAGIGTQRMALRNLGIEHEVVGISEIDKYAIQSYQVIHGETMNFGDISKINPNNLPDFDLFTYSFPCQDLSLAGKQQGMVKCQTRSGLLYECEKIIETKRPKYLLLENVKQLVGKKFYPQFQEWLGYLESLGYTNYWEVLNAKDFNVPQNRERVFVVSILDDKFFEFKYNKQDFTNSFFLDKTTENTYSKLNEKLKKQINSILPKINSFVFCELRCDEGIRTFKNNLCGTLRTIDGCGNKHIIMQQDNEIIFRKLTPNECWRLMGINDDDFQKASQYASKAQLYKQAGNAIVVPVLEMIFKNLFIEG